MHRFPTVFPIDDVRVVVKYFASPSSVPVGEVVESCWWIVGYGAGKIPFPHPGTVDVLALLESLTLAQAVDVETRALSLPWREILKFILDLILKLLEGK